MVQVEWDVNVHVQFDGNALGQLVDSVRLDLVDVNELLGQLDVDEPRQAVENVPHDFLGVNALRGRLGGNAHHARLDVSVHRDQVASVLRVQLAASELRALVVNEPHDRLVVNEPHGQLVANVLHAQNANVQLGDLTEGGTLAVEVELDEAELAPQPQLESVVGQILA